MENVQKLTIKEVSKQLKIPVGKLREWEELFPYALQVERTKTGARLYDDQDLEMLKKIKILKDNNINEDNVNFILNTVKTQEVEEREEEVDEQEFAKIISLQHDTNESIRELTDSIDMMKDDIIHDVKAEIKSEMKIGQSKTKSIIQSYSHLVAETAEVTKEEVLRLREDIYREEEEKLFIQQKLEEREAQFQEFVQVYRETAAAKQRFPGWLVQLFKPKKEGSVDYS
ncbi:hypothetical protein JCM9140_1972 [Halalkalibacter wakoensis JCM 9140]|uniref:HTH merR-type domain-containing protein n=1 Tax=Halalkalibacter wakoensis JCM 9140 TaxID=1236970 RepID=W4Q3M3_9BACI|nr:helix-turn-helix domain-containing protein [Halalkalibacter wakoensis]GAE25949.1 hypothetical protein JCM9140_1972 [Halalkalibacter wakoensis JCM 9140]